MATVNHIDALQSTEAGARLLFERAAQGILSIDKTGRVRDANPAALQMFGFTREGLKREAQWVAGRWLDLVMWSMLDEQWRERQRP